MNLREFVVSDNLSREANLASWCSSQGVCTMMADVDYKSSGGRHVRLMIALLARGSLSLTPTAWFDLVATDGLSKWDVLEDN